MPAILIALRVPKAATRRSRHRASASHVPRVRLVHTLGCRCAHNVPQVLNLCALPSLCCLLPAACVDLPVACMILRLFRRNDRLDRMHSVHGGLVFPVCGCSAVSGLFARVCLRSPGLADLSIMRHRTIPSRCRICHMFTMYSWLCVVICWSARMYRMRFGIVRG